MAKIFEFLKRNSPVILSILAIPGVVATAVLAARGAKKDEQEKTWKNYIPAAAVGTGTILCVAGAAVLNKRQQASLTTAYALLHEGYKRYSDKVRELYGEEAHERVMKDISVEDARDVDLVTYDMDRYDNGIFSDDEEPVLFYENLAGLETGRYFRATPSKVLLAATAINRMYSLGGGPSLNKFYDLLGIDRVEGGDIVGWDNGLDYIDFGYIQNELDDGMRYYIIHTPWAPEILERCCDN